jgi:hypothetical protein
LASISTHFFVTSAGFAEKVFISEFPWTGDIGANTAPDWAVF